MRLFRRRHELDPDPIHAVWPRAPWCAVSGCELSGVMCAVVAIVDSRMWHYFTPDRAAVKIGLCVAHYDQWREAEALDPDRPIQVRIVLPATPRGDPE